MLQDEQIVDLYFDRDERALTETSDKYGNYCRQIARNILNDEETVKECFNDTLFESWNAMPPTRPNCLRVFVGKITRNLSLKRVRSAQTLKRGGGEGVIALDELEECGPDTTASSAEQIEEDMVIREVMKDLLIGLPKQNRRIFMRRYWFSDSYSDIAELTGLSEKTVSVRLTRIRGKMKKYLMEREVFV